MGSKAKQDDKSSEKSKFSCPVYKYPKRTDRYLIFRVDLKSDGAGGSATLSRGVTPAMKWKLMAASLLCCKE
jgi:dynein heavy chain